MKNPEKVNAIIVGMAKCVFPCLQGINESTNRKKVMHCSLSTFCIKPCFSGCAMYKYYATMPSLKFCIFQRLQEIQIIVRMGAYVVDLKTYRSVNVS